MPSAVVACTWTLGASPASDTEEALTFGRQVASLLGAPLHWLILGPAPETRHRLGSRFGAQLVHHVSAPALAEFSADRYVECLRRYCQQESPRLLLFSQNQEARLVAPRLAGRLGTAVVMNCTDLELDGGRLLASAAAYGGDTRVVYRLEGPEPHILSLLPNAVLTEPCEEANVEVRTVDIDVSDVQERIQVLSPAKAEGPRLEEASVIVAGGRGLGNAANFRLVEELAQALGGMAGASRPIVDDGWAGASRQVGLTGKIVRPALYIAAGISGASQHMAGCSAAKTIVAINKDPGAAIFRYARYGIVGDCLEILPEITKAVRAR